MKKIVLSIIMPALLGAYFSTATAQVDKKVLNWYNTEKTGMSTEKAYKKSLKKMTPETVIVAIIDSGIDINHEDLQGKIWTNTKEIAGNGIDDDGNGYIDDIHGWNYLGAADGTNQEHARLEAARIVSMYSEKFEGVEADNVKEADKADFELYTEAAAYVAQNREKYQGYIDQTKQFRDQMLPMLPSMVASAMGIEEDQLTLKKVKAWKAKTPQDKQMKQVGVALLSGEVTVEAITEQITQLEGMLEHHNNPEYDDRSLIGDDWLDMLDVVYGNNDVKGPDSSHGTHVGGIVGATRGNKLGGDGVANNVLLMSLRAVPDGDEFDKDIALAIRYAVDNGAKVINGSFGKAFSTLPEAVYEAIMYAQENDVLFVHAAGNDAKDLAVESNFPAVKYDFQEDPFTHVLTIGASTRYHDGELAASFSNYGQDQVDIFAPGLEIYNTWPENEYKAIQGTSMAAPMVSGVAGLLKGYFPSLTMKEIKDIILASGDDFGATLQTKPGTDEKVLFSTLSKTGRVVNVYKAVELAKKVVANKN